MPQFLLLLAVGAGVYFGAKALRRRMDGFGDRVKAAQAEAEARMREKDASDKMQSGGTGMREIGDLEFDERTQTYRPKE